LLLLVLLLSSACAAKRMQMDPVRVRSDMKFDEKAPDDSIAPIAENIPPDKLFSLGLDYYSSGQKAVALAHFLAVVKRHPEFKRYSHAAYNCGLIYHKWGKYAEALEMYRIAESNTFNRTDRRDARFQMLDVLYQLKDWKSTSEILEAIRKDGGMDPDDAVEVAARSGVVAFETGKYEDAELMLKDAYEMYLLGVGKENVYDTYHGAMAAFYLASIEHKRFEDIKLDGRATYAEMEQQLESKATHLVAAQEWFLKSMRCNDAYWATAAGFRLGVLYEEFYHSFIDAPAPEDLNAEELEGYRCVLSNKVIVLLRKAIRVFERTVEISERLRTDNEWTRMARENLKRLEGLYLKESKDCHDYKVREMVIPGS